MKKSIEEIAYELWEKDGKPEGLSLYYWLKAESVKNEENFWKNIQIYYFEILEG